MPHGPLKMSKEEMIAGFAAGRTLVQEEWAHPKEIQWVNELIKAGKCSATRWRYDDNFQCKVRVMKGKK